MGDVSESIKYGGVLAFAHEWGRQEIADMLMQGFNG